MTVRYNSSFRYEGNNTYSRMPVKIRFVCSKCENERVWDAEKMRHVCVACMSKELSGGR
jgi:hypothetical protein